MIFPDISLAEWLSRHPELKVRQTSCITCSRPIVADRPYISAKYLGLVSRPCECGSTRTVCDNGITRTRDEHIAWVDAFYGGASNE